MIIEEDDWLVECLDALRPGWRGRLLLEAAEDPDSGEGESLVGTVVEEPTLARDPDTDELVDATILIVTNYRDGEFVPDPGQERVSVRISQVLEIEEM